MPLDKSMPLLVVEQRGTYSQLIEDMLRALGFDKVDCAADGETAIELLQASSPKLLVADLHLEPMSGLQLLRTIRAHPRLHRCPFVMTAETLSPAEALAARSAGVDALLLKPFKPEGLVPKLELALQRIAKTRPAPEKVEIKRPLAKALGSRQFYRG